jgi:predicted transglutaminase-like cysteine proteinase
MPSVTRHSAALTVLLGVFATAAFAAPERLAALPAPTPGLTAGAPARPIIAWTEFCQRYPVECRVNPAEPETIALTPQTWRRIVEVNLSVNRSVRPLTDMEHWGVADRWNFPDDGYGDCEDYQLLKRRMLAEAGLPRRAMRMTVVLDELNEGHAVLMLRTDRGDFVLDNKRDDVLSWDATGYIYVKRESQMDVSWIGLNHIGGPTATAARR